jgi:hypothetical protein
MLALIARPLILEHRQWLPRFDAPTFMIGRRSVTSARDLSAVRPIQSADNDGSRRRRSSSPRRMWIMRRHDAGIHCCRPGPRQVLYGRGGPAHSATTKQAGRGSHSMRLELRTDEVGGLDYWRAIARYRTAWTARCARTIDSAERSMSPSVVRQLETEMRMASRPAQLVPPTQHTPSSWTRAMTAAV